MEMSFFRGDVDAGIDAALGLIAGLDADDDDDAKVLGDILSAGLTSTGAARFAERLAGSGFDASLRLPDGETVPTMYASRGRSDPEVLRVLAGMGADVTSCNRSGSNALHILASMEASPWTKDREGEMAKMVRVAEDPGAWMVCNAYGATPMHMAVLNRHHQLLGALLDAGIDPDPTGTSPRQGFGHSIDFDGVTPLHLACLIADTESVTTLLGAGSDPSMADTHGRDAAHYAVSIPPTGFCREYDTPLGKDAVNARKREVLGALPDVGRADDSGRTPLLLVLTSYRYLDGGLAESLLERGADPNTVGNDGMTALMAAASNGHSQAVKALIAAGARLDDQDRMGRTALHHAISWRDERSARLLVKKGARYDIPDGTGVTAGEMAASAGMESVTELMVRGDGMGFLDGDEGRRRVDGSAAYQMLASGDAMGAWTVIGSADGSAPPDVVYNRAMCLRAAGRRAESLEASRTAFRRLTEGVPQRPLDPVGAALVRGAASPAPMHPSMPSASPTYAGIQARWLYCLCLRDAGDAEESSRVAAPLVQLGIKPFPEEDRRCPRSTTCF